MAKKHYPIAPIGDTLTPTMCGWLSPQSQLTTVEDAVTCITCLQYLQSPQTPDEPFVPLGPRLVRAGCREAYPLTDRHADSPPWRTWRQAVQELAQYYDEGGRSISNGDPARFEAFCYGLSAGGNSAQRQALRLSVVSHALELIFAIDWCYTTYPAQIVLSPEQCRALFVIAVCGKPVPRAPTSSTGEVRGKTKFVARVGQTLRDIADDANKAWGQSLTPGDVSEILSYGKRLLQEYLHERDLVAFLLD